MSLFTDLKEVLTPYAQRIKNLGSQVSEVNESLGAVVATNLAANVTYSDGKSVYFDTGAEYSSSSYTVTDYIDITGIDKIYYNRIKSTSGTTKNGIAFYNSSKTYISGIICARGSSEIGYVFSEADVPENAKYIRIPCLKADKPTILYDKDDYDAKLVAKVDVIETEVAGFDSEINAINTHLAQVDENGYFKLDQSKWVLGGYSSYSSTNSRTYNVRYTDIIEFDRDVYIIAEAGFYVTYYLEGGGSDNVCVLKLPKNTKAKICMRRISQDTSETAVVFEWATKHKISTALAPIELYAPTFTDISMFERIGIGGDSYAAGVMSNRSRSWGKCLQRQSGVQVDVYAQSGISVGEWNTNTTNGLPALLAGEECGLYWLHHGINGTSSDAAIGTAADMETTPHPSTFYGQYAEAIEQIQSAFPNARIVLATITGSSYNNYQANGQYKKANAAIKAIAAHFEIPCIDIVEDDFFKLPWYSDYNYSNHPTAMQVAGMAMAYRRLLSKCIMDNPTYFKMYGIS